MKRAIKYFLLFLLLLAIAFFFIGIIIPSFTYESRITVNKPIEQSFKVFNSPFLLAEWIPGLKGVRWISGTQNEIGSKWEMTIELDGKIYTTTEELTVFKENELLAFTLNSDVLSSNVEVKFINKGESTEIISSSKAEGSNIFWKSIFVFYKSIFSKRDKVMYDRLKKVIESN